MERRAGSGPLGFSERSSTVKEYETLTREKVDVVPFGCGMPETHLMQDWGDKMLDLILNGPPSTASRRTKCGPCCARPTRP